MESLPPLPTITELYRKYQFIETAAKYLTSIKVNDCYPLSDLNNGTFKIHGDDITIELYLTTPLFPHQVVINLTRYIDGDTLKYLHLHLETVDELTPEQWKFFDQLYVKMSERLTAYNQLSNNSSEPQSSGS